MKTKFKLQHVCGYKYSLHALSNCQAVNNRYPEPRNDTPKKKKRRKAEKKQGSDEEKNHAHKSAKTPEMKPSSRPDPNRPDTWTPSVFKREENQSRQPFAVAPNPP